VGIPLSNAPENDLPAIAARMNAHVEGSRAPMFNAGAQESARILF
jgi:hypothetical protein